MSDETVETTLDENTVDAEMRDAPDVTHLLVLISGPTDPAYQPDGDEVANTPMPALNLQTG